MGIFSTLNQLNDISFDLEYNTLCGMTRTEIETVFVPELQELALQAETNYDEAIEQLTRQYDGYRFTPGERIYSHVQSFQCAQCPC